MSTKAKEMLCDILKINSKTKKENLFKMLDLIDNSLKIPTIKDTKPAVEEQCEYIRKYLASIDECEAQAIADAWHDTSRILLEVHWYDKMHKNNGGIVNSSGDDAFYMDFSGWLLSRGTYFLINYFTFEYEFVFDYILDNHIPESEYLYECVSYEFTDYYWS